MGADVLGYILCLGAVRPTLPPQSFSTIKVFTEAFARGFCSHISWKNRHGYLGLCKPKGDGKTQNASDMDGIVPDGVGDDKGPLSWTVTSSGVTLTLPFVSFTSSMLFRIICTSLKYFSLLAIRFLLNNRQLFVQKGLNRF